MGDPIYRAPAPLMDEQYLEIMGEEMPDDGSYLMKQPKKETNVQTGDSGNPRSQGEDARSSS